MSWRSMLTAVALIAAGLIGLAVMVPPTHSLTFDSAAIAPEVGRAYVAPAPFEAGRLFQLDADRPETPDASRLKLFENGAPLGPPHSQHATIRTAAGGAFSHWEDHVLFSASDGSDPRINGRRYTAEAPLTLRTSWRVLGLLLAALATAINLPAVSAWLRCAVPRWIGSVRSRKVTTFARANVFLAWLAACATAIVVATIAAALLAPIVMLPLDPTQGRKEGAAVVIPVDVAPSTLYRLVDDGPDAPYGSRLRILEDQRLLGPAHSPHEIVRNTGHGAYSHWGGHLVMSASDGSDPRTNGRQYRAEAKLSLRFPWLLLGWFAFAVAVASAVALLHGTARLGPLVGALRLSARASFEAARPRSRERVSMAALALGCSVAVSLSLVLIGWNWGEATSSGAEIARFLPVSDALGYHRCATSIVAFGQLNETFGGDWCSRRILYTTLLSSLMMISGSDSALVLLLQGALAGLAAAAFVVRIARYVGIAGAGMAAVVLFVYMWEFVLGLFLTEVAGFSLSLFGLVLLMSFAETRRPGELFAGCALFGVAMASRAGALLALPAVALWAWVFVTARPDFRSWRLLAISAAGLSIGAILQVAVVWMIGSDPSNTGGNFAASLYGLSIGTRDWTHAYRDFAPVFQAGEKAAFEHIYRVAFHNIAAHPDIFLGALGSAEVEYLRGIFRFGFFEPANPVLSAFAMLGIVGCVLQWRSPVARLLLLLAMGEVASAPLIFDSGGVRIFGSTIFIRAALCGAGVQLLLLSLVRARSRSDWHALSPQRGVTGVLAAWVGGTVVLAMVISATPVNRLTHLGRVAGTGCPDGLVEVVARIGRESQALTFTSRATMLESVEPFRIGSERFARDQRMRGSAFGEEIIAIERPLTILRAVDLGVHLHGEHVRSLAYRGELESSDEPRSLCVDPNQSIRFVNYPHLLIREVRKLPLAP